MSDIDEKTSFFRTHECSMGLDDHAIREISEAAELVRFDPGDYLHRASLPVKSVFLIVHGRMKQVVVDLQGNMLYHRF